MQPNNGTSIGDSQVSLLFTKTSLKTVSSMLLFEFPFKLQLVSAGQRRGCIAYSPLEAIFTVNEKRSKGFDRSGIYEYNKAYMYTS